MVLRMVAVVLLGLGIAVGQLPSSTPKAETTEEAAGVRGGLDSAEQSGYVLEDQLGHFAGWL